MQKNEHIEYWVKSAAHDMDVANTITTQNS